MTLSCSDIALGIGPLFTCTSINGYVRVRTPFLYPDGDVVDLYLKEHDASFVLSDLGESLRWLRMQTAASKRTIKQSALLADIAMTNRVEISRDMLLVRGRNEGELAEMVMRLGQTAVRVADIWYTFRNRSFASFADEVEEFLDEQHIRSVRDVKVIGDSGKQWNVDFQTLHFVRTAMIAALSTSNTTAAQNATNSAYVRWSDLAGYSASNNVRLISLIDDSTDVWKEPTFRLLEKVSETVAWSRPAEFIELLTT